VGPLFLEAAFLYWLAEPKSSPEGNRGGPVKETLQFLVELQELEDSLRSLTQMRKRRESLEIENAETLEFFETMLTEREAALSEVSTFCKEKNSEIEEAEGNARRARSRLSQIKSQRELTALNKELDTARRTNLARSEELAKLTEQLEASQTDYEKKKAEHAALVEAMADTQKALTESIDAAEVAANDQRTRQVEIKKQVDRTLVSRFERILRGRDGSAVVLMNNETCSACRMNVSPQVYIRLQRMETIENCDHCKRLLVFRAVLEESTSA